MKLPARVALLALLLLPAIHTTVAFDVDFGVAINDVTSSVSTIIGVYDPTCPDGWEYQILGDRCLKIYTEAASWHDANAVCGSHGGSLVMVQGFTANLEVGVMAFTTLGYGNSMWIGYNRIGNNYYWASGDEAELLDGFWSATGLEYGEGCVGIDLEVSGSCPWLLRNCEIQLPYMCEMRPILEDDFVCCNGQHILGSYECDGMEDCNDGTDEIDCQDAVYGGSMTGTYGEITSPGFPDNYYPNNLNCRWQIIAPFGSRIKIRVTDLNTELGYDVLKLYDGCGYDNLVEMLSGYYGPTYEVMSTNNIVKIQFTSDGSGSYEGFSLTWESVEEECGGTFDATTDPVDLFSPGFVLNNEYPHDEECVWILKVYKEDCGSGSRSGSRTGSGRRGSRGSGGASANGCKDDDVITLQFYDFETEYINDVVYVDDGKSPNSNRRLGEISGTDWEYMPGPFISSKSELYIRFSSDSEDQYDGFSASYKSGCQDIELEQKCGFITTPGYNMKDYPNRVTCSWIIMDTSTRGMSLSFDTFQLEDKKQNDYVSVYDGENDANYASILLDEYTGGSSGSNIPGDMHSADGNFYVKFYSNKNKKAEGFKARYSRDCRPLEDLSEGTLISTADVHYRVSVRFSCAPGFELEDPSYDTVVCGFCGHWDYSHHADIPQCRRVLCGQPVPVYHASIDSITTRLFEGLVVYTCDDGYQLKDGLSDAACQDDGSWGPIIPTCLPVGCPNPDEDLPDNVQYTVTTDFGFSFGSLIVYSCVGDYVIYGATVAECGIDGTWSITPPQCQTPYCIYPAIDTTATSFDQDERYQIGDTATISCKVGYKLPDDPVTSAVCLGPLEWDATITSCIDINECNDGSNGCGSDQICTNYPGTYSCSCPDGFQNPVNDPVACVDIDECSDPSLNLCNQLCNNLEGTYECTCYTGYTLFTVDGTNGFYIPTGEDGYHSLDTYIYHRTCVPIMCSMSLELQITVGIAVFPDVCTCEYGDSSVEVAYDNTVHIVATMAYMVSGSYELTCTVDGQFDNEYPTIIDAVCDAPPDIEHGTWTASDDSYAYLSTVQYSCDVGYVRNGPIETICIRDTVYSNGWSQPIPMCEPIQCSVPTHPTNGLCYFDGHAYQDKVICQCNPSYVMYGNAERHCDQNGLWDGATPHCELASCDSPGTPINGRQFSTDGGYFFGAVLYFVCDQEGFGPSPASPMVCISDGYIPAVMWPEHMGQRRKRSTPRFSLSGRSKRSVLLSDTDAVLIALAGCIEGSTVTPVEITLLLPSSLTDSHDAYLQGDITAQDFIDLLMDPAGEMYDSERTCIGDLDFTTGETTVEHVIDWVALEIAIRDCFKDVLLFDTLYPGIDILQPFASDLADGSVTIRSLLETYFTNGLPDCVDYIEITYTDDDDDEEEEEEETGLVIDWVALEIAIRDCFKDVLLFDTLYPGIDILQPFASDLADGSVTIRSLLETYFTNGLPDCVDYIEITYTDDDDDEEEEEEEEETGLVIDWVALDIAIKDCFKDVLQFDTLYPGIDIVEPFASGLSNGSVTIRSLLETYFTNGLPDCVDYIEITYTDDDDDEKEEEEETGLVIDWVALDIAIRDCFKDVLLFDTLYPGIDILEPFASGLSNGSVTIRSLLETYFTNGLPDCVDYIEITYTDDDDDEEEEETGLVIDWVTLDLSIRNCLGYLDGFSHNYHGRDTLVQYADVLTDGSETVASILETYYNFDISLPRCVYEIQVTYIMADSITLDLVIDFTALDVSIRGCFSDDFLLSFSAFYSGPDDLRPYRDVLTGGSQAIVTILSAWGIDISDNQCVRDITVKYTYEISCFDDGVPSWLAFYLTVGHSFNGLLASIDKGEVPLELGIDIAAVPDEDMVTTILHALGITSAQFECLKSLHVIERTYGVYWSIDLPVCVDVEPPKLTCPDTLVIETSEEYFEVVFADYNLTVDATDNVGVVDIVFSSGDNITVLTFTYATVLVRGYDAAGNVGECAFDIYVILKGCPEWSLLIDEGGIKTCQSYFGLTCNVASPDGYDFTQSLPPIYYACSTELGWVPNNRVPGISQNEVPDCSLIVKANYTAECQMYGDCFDVYEDMIEDKMNELAPLLLNDCSDELNANAEIRYRVMIRPIGVDIDHGSSSSGSSSSKSSSHSRGSSSASGHRKKKSGSGSESGNPGNSGNNGCNGVGNPHCEDSGSSSTSRESGGRSGSRCARRNSGSRSSSESGSPSRSNSGEECDSSMLDLCGCRSGSSSTSGSADCDDWCLYLYECDCASGGRSRKKSSSRGSTESDDDDCDNWCFQQIDQNVCLSDSGSQSRRSGSGSQSRSPSRSNSREECDSSMLDLCGCRSGSSSTSGSADCDDWCLYLYECDCASGGRSRKKSSSRGSTESDDDDCDNWCFQQIDQNVCLSDSGSQSRRSGSGSQSRSPSRSNSREECDSSMLDLCGCRSGSSSTSGSADCDDWCLYLYECDCASGGRSRKKSSSRGSTESDDDDCDNWCFQQIDQNVCLSDSGSQSRRSGSGSSNTNSNSRSNSNSCSCGSGNGRRRSSTASDEECVCSESESQESQEEVPITLEITLEIRLVVVTNRSEIGCDDIRQCRNHIADTIVGLENLDLVIPEESEDYDNCPDLIQETPIEEHDRYCSCPPGYTQKDCYCLLCTPGSYEVNGTCVDCPIGSYQDEYGQTECKWCPENHSTRHEGVKYFEYCIPLCRPGRYSDSGLSPCNSCPANYYAPGYGNTECLPCEEGSYSSRSSGECTEYCPVGYRSPTGRQPCFKCPRGFYQDEIGSRRCKRCEDHETTVDRGSDSPDDCVDACHTEPCLNGGTCSAGPGHTWHCECPQHFFGIRCEDETSCASDPCLNSGTCVDTDDSFYCVCPPGYCGDYCQNPPHPCYNNPCLFGGTCLPTDNERGFECHCRDDYHGDFCEEPVDDCESDPCLNDGVCCDIGFDDVVCFCKPDYTGEFCEYPIDDCDPNPCRHGGTCEDGINTFTCHCPVGYSGKRCQRDDDDCADVECYNGGTCIDGDNSYHCDCADGYTGDDCSLEDLDPCDPNPCQNDGSCAPSDNPVSPGDPCTCQNIICTCQPGFTGKYCEVDMDDCVSDPCINGATCVDLVDSYQCECAPGYVGDNCETLQDMCISDPCDNDGTCIPQSNGFICSCAPGWTGSYCEDSIDDCSDNPCENGATCHDEHMSFRCECPPGYSGPTCGEDVNECLQDDLCQNGGTCYNSYGGYFCDCPDGFTGLQCETNIDDCEEGPCENDATCVDLVNGYRCECPPFYEGFNCEKRKLPNFDLYFCMEDRASAQSPTLPFSATVYTYMFWIRYACEDENSNATPFQLLESENADMSDYNVRHEIPTSSSFKILEDTKWHHVAMSWSSASGDLHWYIDGSEVLSRENVDTGVTTPTWLKIFFGRPYESTTNTKAFHGEISQFNMYSREWSAEEIYNASNDCSKRDELGDIVDWVYCSYLLVGCSHVIRPSICGDSSCPANDIYRGCACTDKEPPEVIECPDVVRIVDPENHLVPCDYEEPSFLDNVGVADMTCSIVRGTTLAWGVYYVNCIATDEAGNSAVCGFSLYIIPFDCEDPAPPIKGSKTCDMWHSGHFCNIACNAGHEFSELPKPFYVCGNDGSWDPANPDEPFVFPGCSRTDPADALCEGSIMYTVSDCNPEDPYGLEEPNSLLRQAFIDRMNFADTMYGICGGTGCDFTNTVITCDEVSNRRKRQADQTSAEIAFAFNSSTFANDGSSIDDTLETAAFNGDLNAPGFTADPNTIDSTTSFSCPEGRILNGESCVYCAEGEFHNVTEDECQKCPKGSYQSEEGKVSCNQCGEQKTTAGKGATSASECLVSCNVGYANKDGRCQPCQIGMYQDEPAKFSCKACPSGMSTANAASISLDDCEVKCMQAGKQLGVSGNCEPCPVGTYGLQGVTSCARCPYGFTTSVTGAVSADECNVVECNSGSYKKRPSDNCEPCPIGEYQSRLGASYCYKCPPHYTTSTVGSVREEQCYICEEGVQCNPDPCENNYCGNDGTCSVDRLGEPVCECINGASGDRCQVAELCNNYCENEGVCSIDSRGYPTCSCESEWIGDRCHLEAKKFGGRSITNKKQLAGIVGGSLTAVIVLISIAYFLTVRHLKKKRGPLYPSEPPPEYKTHIMYDNAIYGEAEDFKKPGELESEPQSQAAVDKQIYHYNYAYQEEKEPQPSTSGSSGNSTPKQLPTQGDVHVDVTTPGGVRFDS